MSRSDFGRNDENSYSGFEDKELTTVLQHSRRVHFNHIMLSEKKCTIEEWLTWVIENVPEVYVRRKRL